MFKKIKTVDTILSAFTKTITELEAAAEAQENRMGDLRAERAKISLKIDNANEEAHKARKAAEKLRAVVED